MSDSRLRLPSQSARFHAICREVAAQSTFGGRKLSAQQWKLILVSAHMIAAGDDPDLAIGLEGELVSLREQTSRMSVSRLSSLIEYATAYAVVAGITLAK